MLYTLEGYDENLYGIKKSLKKTAKSAVKHTTPIAKKAIAIAKNPEVVKAGIMAASTVVGVPPTVTATVLQTATQLKADVKSIKTNPVIKNAIKEVVEQKENKVITDKEIDTLFEIYDKKIKGTVQTVLENISIAKEYWTKGELV